MSKPDYDKALRKLQIALVQAQTRAMTEGRKVVVVFEGRDAAGKDGAIRRVVEHLSARNTRALALPKPTERENGQWWFQRYVQQLPTAGEWVLFNRSWYNRAGVERVMGFSSPEAQEAFLREAPMFEAALIRADITLVKFWLDISKEEQAKRLESRRDDPLKALKTSALDAVAQEKWDAYSAARNDMLTRTHTDTAPWICIAGDHKKAARLNLIRSLLLALEGEGKGLEAPDPAVAFPFEQAALTDGRLAP